jgi:hypothetical protein
MRHLIGVLASFAVAALAASGCGGNAYCWDCQDGAESGGAGGRDFAGTGAVIEPQDGTGGLVIDTECDADLDTDPENCGFCGFVCEIPAAFPACEARFCVIDRCALGFYDVDGKVENGCEYACEPARRPDGSALDEEELCDDRDDDCDGLVDEIFDTNTDVEHCGGCNRPCPSPPNGRMECVEGECVFAGCLADYEDRNGDVSVASIAAGTTDGCECNRIGQELCNLVDDDCDGEIDEGIDLETDPENCGVCGNVCGELFPNALTSCADAVCVFDDCRDGFIDLDGELLNGCEYECTPTGPELCDGEDNDCNGFVDDDPTDVGEECGSSVGECRTGTVQCVAGAPSCEGAVEPSADVCDGLNNDCDADGADEDCPTVAAPTRLDLGTEPGEYSSAQLSVAASGHTVLAAWVDRRNERNSDGNPVNADIYCNVSQDDGVTWQDPDAPVVNDSDDEEIEPWVFASPTTAYLVFGRYAGTAARRISFTRNPLAVLDEPWAGAVPVEVAPPAGSDSFYGRGVVANAAASGDEDQIVVVWQTLITATSSRDVYLQASSDGGATWLDANVRVNPRAADDVGRAELPSLATDGAGRVYIAWRDAVSGRPEAWFDVWDFADGDGGALTGGVQLSADDAASTKAPVLAADTDGNVHVLWTDLPENESKRVQARSSDNGGRTFAPEFLVSQPPPGAHPDADMPTVVARSGVAVAAWEDTRAGLSDVYAARWSDGAWSAPVKAAGAGRGEFRTFEPQLAFGAGSRVFVAYRAYRGAGADDVADVFVNFSDGASGLLFQPQDTRADFDGLGATDSFGQRLAPLGTSPDGLVLWLDNRDGPNADPYAARIEF